MRKAIQKMAIPVVDLGSASDVVMPNAALIQVRDADVGDDSARNTSFKHGSATSPFADSPA